MKETIGNCDCPICKAVGRHSVATVHRESRGKQALYFRCPECGTIQPRMAGGQAAMQKLLRAVQVEKTVTADGDKTSVSSTQGSSTDQKQAAKPKKGFLHTLLTED